MNTEVLIQMKFNHTKHNRKMKIIAATTGLLVLLTLIYSFTKQEEMKTSSVYNVSRLKQSMKIDANWDKPQWRNTKAININNYLGEMPKFQPSVQAKMMYDDENIYVIFHVNDRYVRCVAKETNDSVWVDSCVEFFFAPDTQVPERYFNLEVNCGGTPLMHYNIVPRKDIKTLDVNDIKKIEIAHTLPKKIDPEITEPVTWSIEYKIPLAMISRYSKITYPKSGVIWRANFYNCAEKNSNPHFITWAKITNSVPDFHLPQFFGILKFE